MSDKYIEKAFLYFLTLSLIAHLAIFALVYLFPESKREVKQEAYMVELSDMPELKQAPPSKAPARRFAERKRRVVTERAPRGQRARDNIASAPRRESRPEPLRPAAKEQERERSVSHEPVSRAENGAVSKEGTEKKRAGETVRKGKDLPDLAKLYPSAGRLARLEESYRKKYDTEIEEGDTKFLNTDDIQFGSFLRRFESAVYGVWRYPDAAARSGIQGVTPVKITFNRRGEIENIQLLQSSGSKILDSEVFRALRSIGPLGGFPKAYPKEQFNLIAFFQYGISQGGIHGRIR
ncbi:MAG: transport protein TonB [Syntrophus sp. PtaB.Bin138]|nr:MAG: transport protein TonB [Syntrophus sp. PtaB.Bin138]